MRLALTIALVLAAVPALADVVELMTGQRVEGTLKQADQATVTIEVGGQAIIFKAEQVRAMYYGSTPATALVTEPAREALRALKALQSAATAGVTYPDYAPRVIDAKIQVDRYLAGKPAGAERLPISKAMDFYLLASSAWNAKVSKSGYDDVGGSPLVAECPALAELIRRTDANTSGRTLGQATVRGISISTSGVPDIWSCAAAQLAEAEKLMAETK
jgi:hypothetical protein